MTIWGWPPAESAHNGLVIRERTLQTTFAGVGVQRGVVVERAQSMVGERRSVMKNVESMDRSELRVDGPVGGNNEGPKLKVTALDATRTGAEAEDLANKLRSRVVGQDEAIQHIASAYQTYLAGLSPIGRRIGNFLFLGPTGSGKTRLVEATAECLLGDRLAVIKIDCAGSSTAMRSPS